MGPYSLSGVIQVPRSTEILKLNKKKKTLLTHMAYALALR